MAVKFDFLSPGVLLREFDVSQLPREAAADGICIIGTAPQGPGNIPVKVRDYETFEQLYGVASAGRGYGADDEWRGSSFTDVSYGMYAARAWLKTTNAPVTYVRLIGEKSSKHTTGGLLPGWTTTNTIKTSPSDVAINGGAYGLFVFPSGGVAATDITGTLGAVFYVNSGALRLSGTMHSDGATGVQSVGQGVRSAAGNVGGFTIEHLESDGATPTKYSFDFAEDNGNSSIRNIFNTSPQKTNSDVTDSTKVNKADEHFWLGESYLEMVQRTLKAVGSGSAGGRQVGVLLHLGAGSGLKYNGRQREATYAKSGWYFSQDPEDKGVNASYDVTGSTEKLFRIASIYKGSQCQKDYQIKIDIKQMGDSTNPYSSFDLALLDRPDSGAPNIVEQFVGLNLNPKSSDFIAKRIGNQHFTWSESEKKYKMSGQFPNLSSHIRVEMAAAVSNGALINKGAAPWGVHGPMTLADAYYGGAAPALLLSSSTDLNANHTHAGMFAGDDSQIVYGHAGTTPAAKATYSVQFADRGSIADNDGFTFTDKDGATQVVVAKTAEDQALGQFNRTLGSEVLVALSFKNCVNNQTGAKFTATFDSTDGTNKTVLVTQKIAGADGNIAVAIADGGSFDGNAVILANGGTFVGGTTPSDLLLMSDLVDGAAGKVKIEFPSLQLTRENSSAIGGNYAEADIDSGTVPLGVRHSLASSENQHGSYIDLVRCGPAQNGGTAMPVYPTGEGDPGPGYKYQYSFTLDEVVWVENSEAYYFAEGSRAGGTLSLTAESGSAFLVATQGHASFVSPLFGGFDGVDITEPNPFTNRYLGGNGLSHTAVNNNYAVYSLNKAFDTIRDSEVVGMDIVSYPGLTKPALTKQLLTLAATRGDCLAIIDPESGLSPAGEDSVDQTAGSISQVVTKLRGRRLNNSYGAMWYPWVYVDVPGANSIPMPPSVAAIGAIAGSDLVSFPWFAPAGFRRGGLSPLGTSASGMSVISTEEHLTKKNRDSLYSNNINPIARFPASNDIVMFGQKTLQRTRSALDRINVRRMMIFLKKQIGVIADSFLFEQNAESTWFSFKAQAGRVLAALQADGGISEYKLVLDKTTTTDDMVDRNILYAKVFVKPARSIEFIVVDFVITKSGADFGSVSY